ncbi:MAG: hypothetical protein PGN16_19650 [Sphingomonas phyllosphaerae]|uniref:hypothetical protein n=1 Tax=Sphingomonas phyllosphaerae TaxID=257003 RepID=UPI002FF679FF
MAVGAGATSLLSASEKSTTRDGVGDCLQQRYDALAAGGGGTLTLPPGTIYTNLRMHSRTVHLCGAGRGATILVPADPQKAVLSQAYRSADWSAVTIADLSIKGLGRGTAIDFGDDDADRYSGRTILRNISVTNFQFCIRRATGNIGITLYDCQFDSADYHIWGRAVRTSDGSIMHSGIIRAQGCHFQGATKAAIYVDSPTPGSGLITFEACLFENNPGSVFVFSRFEGRDGVPGISIQSCWNENNATADESSALQIGNRLQPPVFLFADRVAQIEFTDTPVGTMVLRGDTTVLTKRCALDLLNVIASDLAASITHDDARAFGGKVIDGVTRSIANGNQRNEGPAGPIFRVPHRIAIVHPKPTTPYLANSCDAPITLEGKRRITTKSVPDAVLPGMTSSQQVDFSAGDTSYAGLISTPERTFLAWTFTYRKISGANVEFVVAGSEGISTAASLNASDWTTIGGVAYIEHALDQLGFLLRCTEPSSIRIGGYQMITFSTRAAATAMINNGLFHIPLA